VQKEKSLIYSLIVLISLLSFSYIFLISQKSSKEETTPQVTNPITDNNSQVSPIIDYELNEESQPEKTEDALLLDSQEQIRGTSTGASFSVLTFPLSSSTIATDTAGDDDCSDNCPTKSLVQYVKDNGGQAGMNGTYFCPPDYSWCSGKVNSYDFPVWNNRKKKWMQSSKLFWGGRGMFVFRPGSAQFFSNASSVGAPSDITGGIINYPSLIAGGNVVLNEGSLPDNLKITKGTRSGIGVGGGKIFLVVARKANMGDLVKIFQSLGATDALNLDGGGSAALYQGKYKAGPGRNLPNAIIVK